jgi:hypothetical protein
VSDASLAWREGVVVPWLLVVVCIAASVRVTIDGELRVLPPPLSAVMLAVLVLTVLVRSGQLVPARLAGRGRPALHVLNGISVLVALGWASASVVALVTPEAGLPKLAGLILLAALLVNTLAAAAGRIAALRALFVACAAAFVVKFIVLAALYDPTRGLGGWIVATFLDGVTLGSFGQVVWAPVTGYLAFATVVAYFVAIVLLPHGLAEPDRLHLGDGGPPKRPAKAEGPALRRAP